MTSEKKSSENALLVFFRALFFNISRKTVNLISKVNQQNVLNLYMFHNFPKNLDRTITYNSVALKIHRQNLKNVLFFSTKQI